MFMIINGNCEDEVEQPNCNVEVVTQLENWWISPLKVPRGVIWKTNSNALYIFTNK